MKVMGLNLGYLQNIFYFTNLNVVTCNYVTKFSMEILLLKYTGENLLLCNNAHYELSQGNLLRSIETYLFIYTGGPHIL